MTKESVTLDIDRLRRLLRHAALSGMDATSGPCSEFFGSASEIADEHLHDVISGLDERPGYHDYD